MQITETREERNIYRLFKASVLLKGAISAAEIIAGVLLAFFSLSQLSSFGFGLLAYLLPAVLLRPLQEHADVLVAQVAVFPAYYVALYIGSRGLIKLALIVALLKGRLFAYPSSLVVLGLFLAYQVYQLAVEYSAVILGISLFDIVVMYFIWREWRIVRAHLSEKEPSRS